MNSPIQRLSILSLIGLTHLASASVDWQPWSDATIDTANALQKPIYLFIDDPLSELATSMDQDTFSNAEVAAFLNEHFVSVRASRDEIPGVAAYGQQWLAAEQKLPGWPLNLWFTPEKLPIEGASYLPPTEEWGREGFMVVAKRAADLWEAGPGGVARSAQRRQELIADYLPFAAEGLEDLQAALDKAAADWRAQLDPATGLFGEAPHLPEPELLRFLIARGGEDQRAALGALRARLVSPLLDPIDGGVFRSTVDTQGGLPVFQKRLIDQARLALACLDAAQVSHDLIFAAGAKNLVDYAVNRLSPGDGTFILGEDATADPTGLRQTWAWAELVDLIGEDQAKAMGALPAGNIDPEQDLEGIHQGRNILSMAPSELQTVAALKVRLALQRARIEGGDPRIHQTANAGAHALMLHVMQRIGDEQNDLDHGHYLLATRAALQRDFAAGTAFFSHLPNSDVPALPSDYLLAAMSMDQPEWVATADELFYDAEFGLYYATADKVMGVRPLVGMSSAGQLPGPDVWRVMAGDADETLVMELTAAFDNPEVLPSGAVLLALQSHLRAK
jgi:uncharacterized protein